MTISDRVFCIGMNKTGTTSILRCFGALGLEPIAPSADSTQSIVRTLFEREDYEPSLRFAEEYRSFKDRPWNVWEMYKHLDKRFPGSRFVLTVRDPESWWESVQRWIFITKPWMAVSYRRHLRADNLLKHSMIDSYLRRQREIQQYFQGRDNLLVIELAKGQGWEPLCSFLDQPIPNIPFPYVNQQNYDHRDRNREASQAIRPTGDEVRNRKVSALAEPCHFCGNQTAEGQTPLRIRTRQWVKNSFQRAQQLALSRNSGSRHISEPSLVGIRTRMPTLKHDELAAVCAYFNPHADHLVHKNYQDFRVRIKRAGIPLYTVELALDESEWQLCGSDEELLQVRSKGVFWQKERLLNLGIEELLRRGFRKIMWLDTNIAFENEKTWPQSVASQLEESKACQVFDRVVVHHQRQAATSSAFGALNDFKLAPWRKISNWLERKCFWGTAPKSLDVLPGVTGGGWAARAEVLRKANIYDAAILGGGDRMLFAACHEYTDDWFRSLLQFTHYPFPSCKICRQRIAAPEYSMHFGTWAQQWSAAISGSVACVEQTMHRFPDGGLSRWNEQDHRNILLRHGYDPAADLATNDDGVWEWGSNKPALHNDVRNCFSQIAGCSTHLLDSLKRERAAG